MKKLLLSLLSAALCFSSVTAFCEERKSVSVNVDSRAVDFSDQAPVIDSDYVRLAESKGMEGRLLIRRHVLRNALVPIVTVLAPLIVDLLTGALVVEKIYGINGIGKLMVDAIAGEGVD